MQNWLKVFFLFFIFGLLVYFNSLNNKFILDDYVFINNPVLSDTKFILSQWNPYREQALGVMDNEEHLAYYRPMAHMVYDFCYTSFKDDFWKYHLLNLFLFVLASSLVYLFIERITGNYNLAFLTGLFYLIHPINGIVVNYISADVFSFQVIFMLGTILLLLESLERNSDRVLYILSLFLSFLSLFWNESGMMIPFYVCAVILIFRKDPFKNKALYLFPYFLIVFSFVVFRAFFLSSDVNFIRQMAFFHITGGEYLASLFRVFIWYISKLFYPQGIVMQWATPIVHEHLFLNILGLCSLFMVFLLLFIRFAKEKILQMAVVWISIGFAPVFLAAVIRLYNGVEIEPHWFILSSIGFFILLAYFCSIVLERTKKAGLILLFILVFIWGSVSHAYNRLWVDQKTYALYWSQQVPNLRLPFYAVADAYNREGNLKESLKYYKMALTGYSTDADVYLSLGMIDDSEGNWKEAELDYKKALKINPFSSYSYNDLGALYLQEGQFKKADKFFHQALAYNPLMTEPRRGLATIYFKHSDYKKAIDLCLINLGIVNSDTNTLFLLVDIYVKEKDFANVKKYIYRIISYENDPEVLTRIGVDMAQNNAPDLALDCFTKVLHVSPDYIDAYFAIGTLLANLSKYDQAINVWKLGLSIDPSDNRFKKSIAKARELLLSNVKK